VRTDESYYEPQKMPKSTTWILVCDSQQARIFEIAAKGRVDFLGEYGSELPRNREIAADRPGRTFDRAGPGRHAMEPRQDAHRQAKRNFLSEMADRLDRSCRSGDFTDLVVIAPPTALGDLRSVFSKRIQTALVQEHAKEVSGLSEPDLVDYLKRIDVI